MSGRPLLLRALALLAGALLATALLGGVEFTLRVFDLGPSLRHDPFAGFSNRVPMFEPAIAEDGQRIYRTHPARRVLGPQRFAFEKPSNGFRAFVVGGSSAAGMPYPPDLSFSGWLEQRLAAALPDRHVEVINAAVGGYASRRVLAVVRELAHYEPDLLVIYSGHNESGERRFYAHLLEMDPRLFRLREALYGSRIYALLAAAWERMLGVRDSPPELHFDDVDNSLQMFAAATRVVEAGELPSARELAFGDLAYRNNLESMIDAMRDVNARTLILSLTQNLADWPPGTSSHRAGLAEAEHRRFQAALDRGRRLAQTDCEAALESLREALAIDDEFAALHFEIAGCLRRLGRSQEATRQYQRASDLDRVPLGAPSRFNRILAAVARERGTLYLDVAALVEAEARRRGELVGYDFVIDVMHPTLATHRLIAAAIADFMKRHDLPEPAAAWRSFPPFDPPLEALYATRPELRDREHLIRSVSCLLLHSDACARDEARAVLARAPHNERARALLGTARERLAQRARDARPESAPLSVHPPVPAAERRSAPSPASRGPSAGTSPPRPPADTRSVPAR